MLDLPEFCYRPLCSTHINALLYSIETCIVCIVICIFSVDDDAVSAAAFVVVDVVVVVVNGGGGGGDAAAATTAVATAAAAVHFLLDTEMRN